MEKGQDNYWELFWRTGLPEAYVMSRRSRGQERKAPGAPAEKEKRGG